MEKIKVLLVEDEPTLAMIIKDTLDGNEFDITLAANGEEGLSRYAEIKPDIIVEDIMMPKMDLYVRFHHADIGLPGRETTPQQPGIRDIEAPLRQ